jgi:hypothetical protein
MNRIFSDVGLHNAVAGAMAMIPALAVSSVFAGAASAAAETPADAVLRNAYVYTVDASMNGLRRKSGSPARTLRTSIRSIPAGSARTTD